MSWAHKGIGDMWDRSEWPPAAISLPEPKEAAQTPSKFSFLTWDIKSKIFKYVS